MKAKKPSKIDSFKEIIETKLDLGVSTTAIYHFIKEKEHLNPLPPQEIIQGYQEGIQTRKVSNESMITYGGKNTQSL